MPRREREVSNKQRWAIEDVIANQLDIDDHARNILLAAKENDIAGVVLNAGDIRNLSVDARNKLAKILRGEYDK